MRQEPNDATGEKLAISLHIILSNFNDIIGPEVLYVIPPLDEVQFKEVCNVVPYLMDIDIKEVKSEPFIYANQYFSSHNVGFTLPKFDGRALESEYMLSVVIIPPDTRGLIALVGLKGFLISIRDACVPLIIKFHQLKINNHQFKDRIIESMYGYLLPAKEFVSVQLKAFGSGVVSIMDF